MAFPQPLQAATQGHPWAQGASQETATGDFVVTITGDRLNVRSGPGLQNDVVGKLFLGDQVHVDAQNVAGSWYRVILADGTQGWIAADFTERVDGVLAVNATLVAATSFTALPATATTNETAETTLTAVEASVLAESAAEEATDATAKSPTVEVTTPTAFTTPPNMNVRGGPGTNYPVVTSVPAGSALPVLALNPAGDWYQVQVDGLAEPAWVYVPLTTAAGPMETVVALAAEELPAPPEPVAASQAQPAAPAVVNAPPPSGAGFFGYGIQVNAWQGDKGGSAGMVRDLGFAWAKQQARWEFMENSPGAVDWSETDQIIDVLHGNGINVLFSVVTAPQWTRPDKPGTGGPPNDFNLYANFVGAMAGRYCGRLQAIEVWNEQNLQREWEGFPLDPALYMDLLRRSYGAIKAACPSMIVVSGATTPTGNSPVAVDDIDYLRGMYNNGLAQYSDAVGVHPSGYGQPPNVTFQDWQAGRYEAPSHVNHRSFYFRSTMEESRNVMVQYGDVNKRLWPTEFGWASSQSPHPGYEYAAYNSPQQQAQYTVEAYTMMRNWGWVGVPFLWNLNYNFGEMAQWSIMGKPVYDALKNMPK
ncbi:MAG TPA: SH3 domain-containing protein [Caldilineaceae bacterium]|nr:SH3 domain-containing protein [Caldilineaceae bacterium]